VVSCLLFVAPVFGRLTVLYTLSLYYWACGAVSCVWNTCSFSWSYYSFLFGWLLLRSVLS
jgi:hypothetical protein